MKLKSMIVLYPPERSGPSFKQGAPASAECFGHAFRPLQALRAGGLGMDTPWILLVRITAYWAEARRSRRARWARHSVLTGWMTLLMSPIPRHLMRSPRA